MSAIEDSSKEDESDLDGSLSEAEEPLVIPYLAPIALADSYLRTSTFRLLHPDCKLDR